MTLDHREGEGELSTSIHGSRPPDWVRNVNHLRQALLCDGLSCESREPLLSSVVFVRVFYHNLRKSN